MSMAIRLLGHPRIEDPARAVYRFRSQKSWALLAYLLLADRPPPRRDVAELLFGSADDPLGALRWSLAEIRRGLGDGATLGGDPLTLHIPAGATVDVEIVTKSDWRRALAVIDLGSELLEGMAPQAGASFDSWLAAERRRLGAASEAILHEAALGLRSQGDLPGALACATRAARLNPWDENLQALVIRLHRQSGDITAAREAYDSYRAGLREELGVEPGQAVESAWREEPLEARTGTSVAVVLIEAGEAAVSAGAVTVGLSSLRSAVAMADRSQSAELRLRSRLVLAETLIHSARGLDEDGISTLHEGALLAESLGEALALARIQAELGYVDFLRARYGRATRWLSESLVGGAGDDDVNVRALMYLGSIESDRAEYSRAVEHLRAAATLAEEVGLLRGHAYATSMLGRVHLMTGDLDAASDELSLSMGSCEAEHWLSFLPGPPALLGVFLLARADVAGATSALEHAFARACQVGDPCWEGISARGLALVADAAGDAAGAFALLDEAGARSSRVADAYVWLDAYILDARCALGRRHGHPETGAWVDALSSLAERTGMRELRVRALVHGAALGRAGDAEVAARLAEAIESPILRALVAAA
ncbi:MAG: BTAD domain-containing putative transcriptional regulator [Candidatus Nanopelagicales bacterium]